LGEIDLSRIKTTAPPARVVRRQTLESVIPMAKKKESFEEALQKLEKIVARMEEADVPLDEALQGFEEGVRLARFCSKKLDEAEQKVAMLVRDESGTLQPAPFSEEGDGD